MTALDVDLSGFVSADGDEPGRLELLVPDARCAACIATIERGVASEPGVASARLNLTTRKLSVSLTDTARDPRRIIEKLDALGYRAVIFDPATARQEEGREGRSLILALGVAGFGVGNSMMFTVPVWAGLFGQELEPSTRSLMYWLSALVATPCALFAGRPFFVSAWNSLRRGKANMDVPISIGVLLTLVVSFSELFQGGAHAYFDATVTLLFLLLIGRWLDHKLRARAEGAARDLLALQTPVARRLTDDGREIGAPASEIIPGERIAVAPGERAPVDARVESGVSLIDNSAITGESRATEIGPGAVLHGGALVLDGRLVARAIATAADSAPAAIVRLMEAGAESKSAYVRLADKAASVYVPVVHSLAAVTFLGGLAFGLGFREALIRAAALLIVTCPCALGLAVPAVQIAATGRLFRTGSLVKSGAALERIAECDWVVFDKTGVLTEGRPAIGRADAGVVEDAAPLARASRHPLARAVALAAGPGRVADSVREVAGQGVEGRIDGVSARLGRAGFVGAASGAAGGTELWFAREGETPRRITFTDKIRPGAREALDALKSRGLPISILSGDAEGAVADVAHALGVEDFRAGLTPVEKADAIRALVAAGRKPLMIGDGLNDAGALACAHASLAPGQAVEASQSAADVVFAEGDLGAVAETIDVARAATGRALENFAFSALYNIVAAPAAILGLINPLVAAIAMSASSLIVTLNALRMAWAARR